MIHTKGRVINMENGLNDWESPKDRRARYRRQRKRRFIVRLAVFIAFVAAVIFALFKLLPEVKPETPIPQDELVMPPWVIQDMLPENKYSRPGITLDSITAIVVHYTGNPDTTAEQTRSYFASLADTGQTYASSHFIVGMDGTVIQCVPLDEMAYASNQRNNDTISIEVCHPDTTGEFTEESEDALIELLTWLCDTYVLERDDIIRHYDVSGKECPIYYVNNPAEWEALKNRVKA